MFPPVAQIYFQFANVLNSEYLSVMLVLVLRMAVVQSWSCSLSGGILLSDRNALPSFSEKLPIAFFVVGMLFWIFLHRLLVSYLVLSVIFFFLR